MKPFFKEAIMQNFKVCGKQPHNHGADHYTQQLAKRSQEQWTMDHKGGLT